ncbi:MAG: hypothetical protein R3B06_16720 [Kofleriaceae bacterium]
MHRLIAFAAVIVAASAARADRLAPWATQQASLGCWDVGGGATLTLTPVGKHSVRATSRFGQRPRGGPAVIAAPGQWVALAGAYQVPCRPRSQHGSFCLVRPVAAGLAVAVYARRHDDPGQGRLVETRVATRCRGRASTNAAAPPGS